MPRAYAEELEAGRKALADGRFPEARSHFESALALDETGEVTEALGEALWWLHDPATIDLRERAYRIYRRGSDKRSAARLATALSADYFEFRGETALAQGWMQRAHRLLEGEGECAELGWWHIWDGHATLMISNDADRAIERATAGAAIARRLGIVDMEMLGLSLEGLARVTAGDVAEGIRCLDEGTAAIVAGDMTDANAMATTICYMMDACDRIRDYDRAAQWCARALELIPVIRMPEIMAVCRPHYAVVLMWRGEWAEAESQLLQSNREIMGFRPAMVTEGIVRLAELRWRQGRWGEADELFEQAKTAELAQLGRAELALSRGDVDDAIDLAGRYLRRIPPNDRIERAFGLEVMVRALVEGGRPDEAAAHAAELRDIAARVATDPMRAAAALAAGVIAEAVHDHERARSCLEDAADLFERHGAPFEAARARVALARSLGGLDRIESALRELNSALASFQRMGAVKETESAMRLLRELDPGAARVLAARDESGLTTREIEVLRLIAGGRSNQEIADQLVLSIRTVERHISTIYEKLGATGKTARAAATAYAHQNGLT